MPNRADRLALIERVEKATKNDPRLFRAVYMALLPEPGPFNRSAADAAIIEAFIVGGAFTDAALALLERVLPGWAVEMERWKSECSAKLWECDDKGWHRGGTGRSEAIAATLPLAIIAATLRAMQQENAG